MWTMPIPAAMSAQTKLSVPGMGYLHTAVVQKKSRIPENNTDYCDYLPELDGKTTLLEMPQILGERMQAKLELNWKLPLYALDYFVAEGAMLAARGENSTILGNSKS